MESKGEAEGNTEKNRTRRTPSRENMFQGLIRVRQTASKGKDQGTVLSSASLCNRGTNQGGLLLVDTGCSTRGGLGERAEGHLPESGQDEALDDLYSHFRLRFVFGTADPGGDDGGVIVIRHVTVGGVYFRLVAAGLGHPRAQIVRDYSPGNRTEEVEGLTWEPIQSGSDWVQVASA